MPALAELEAAYLRGAGRPGLPGRAGRRCCAPMSGRPTPLTYAARLSDELGGAQIYLKREDLAHSGAHKINNALGQALLAQRMGKRRIIAETGAGQHGVATATVAALLGLECVVYMGTVDIARQQPNVLRMKLLGAEVRPVESGSRTLKDAINEAIRDWVTNVGDTHYLLGSALGPHPYPTMVRDFQSVIGREAREQILAQAGRLPDACIACVGGGSNAIGLFHAFRGRRGVRLIGVEAGGEGIGDRAATRRASAIRAWAGRACCTAPTPTCCRTRRADRRDAFHLRRAGLSRGRAGARLPARHRARRIHLGGRREALAAFQRLARTEGILPALESAHAVAEAIRRAPGHAPGSASCWSTSPGGGIKTWTRSSKRWAMQPGQSQMHDTTRPIRTHA